MKKVVELGIVSLHHKNNEEKFLLQQPGHSNNKDFKEPHRQKVEIITEEYLSRKIRDYFERRYKNEN